MPLKNPMRLIQAGTRSLALWLGVGAVCLALVIGGWFARSSGHAARSRRSFDQIQQLVTGRTEEEVERILGAPDAREARLLDDDVWIWWDYTYLDGVQYPPELRGQIIHLEITFEKPPTAGGDPVPHSQWHVEGPFSVNYSRRQSRS